MRDILTQDRSMNLLRCATHVVRDVAAAAERFERWLNYRVVEEGLLPAELAAAWDAPASSGRVYAICQPASGAQVFLRFVEGDPVPDYRPIRSFGWAAIEICVQDVLAVNQRMVDSPFKIIGPPNRIAGLSTIYPMQVRGADQEILYLTEITTADPNSGLPRAGSLIDKLFILVLACRDMKATASWFADVLKLEVDAPIAIRYSMISKSFDLPISDLHEIVTARWGHNVFLEFDQYPEGAVTRPANPGALPPGVSICSLAHPDFEALAGPWFCAPVARQGVVYMGRRAGILKTPEGALVEVINGQ